MKKKCLGWRGILEWYESLGGGVEYSCGMEVSGGGVVKPR